MMFYIAGFIGLVIAYKLACAIAREIADERNYRQIMRDSYWDIYLRDTRRGRRRS